MRSDRAAGHRDAPTITSFVAQAVARPKLGSDLVLGRADNNVPAHLLGFARVINAQQVRKNLKRHGDPMRLVRGQPPIVPRDFELIPCITGAGAFRELGNPSARKPQRLEYRYAIGDRVYVYTETIGRERKRLALLSLYRLA